MYCKHCGKVIDDDCIVCPNCGKQVNMLTNNVEVDDNPNSVLVLLSFLLPLVGLIIMCVNLDKKPKMAKECGVAALCGFLLGVFILPLWSCTSILF